MKTYQLVAGALVTALVIGGAVFCTHAQPTTKDTRTLIDLSADQNAAVRGEMRKLLASVADIVEGIDENDFTAVETAARASGMSMAAQVEVSLKKKLPMGFMKLGKGVHVGFDEIADAALSDDASKDKLISKLAGQLQRCVACHATYKLK